MAAKPNIVLLFPDQQRGDSLGHAGNAAAQTPILDRLAAEGVLFSRCFTNGPLCMPARASLMTGQPVHAHGVWGNNLVEADRQGASHVRNIRDAGYHTAVIGKTHLYPNHLNDGHLSDHAWKLKEWGYQHVHELRDVVPSDRCNCYYSDFLKSRGHLERYLDYTRMWWFGARWGTHPWEDPPSPLPVDEHIDVYCADTAADWIRQYDAEKPFYLQVCFTGPHTPFDSPAEFRDRFSPEDMPLAIMEPPRDPVSPQVERQVKAARLSTMTASHSRVMRSYYYAKVALIDHAVGRVIEALEQRNQLENTWIVFTSDHGDMLGDHRLNQKLVFYEGAIHVPLIIRPPGGIEGSGLCSMGLTDHLDVSATLLDAAGAAPIATSPGISLLPWLGGAASPETIHDVVFSEVERYYAMARTDRYKMAIDVLSRKVLELYDLENDPTELDNLAEDPALVAVREQLLYDFEALGLDRERLEHYQRAVKKPPVTDNFIRDLANRYQ